MSGEGQTVTSFDVTCPHCRKQFVGRLIQGAAARYRGFKCPHCKLFVPSERAGEREQLEPTGSSS